MVWQRELLRLNEHDEGIVAAQNGLTVFAPTV